MMTSTDPEKRDGPKKRYLIPVLVIAALLVGGLIIGLLVTGGSAPAGTSAPATVQINLPTTQYPTIPPSAADFTVSIHSVNSSGITGSATFKDIAGTVAILLHIDGPPEEESEESIMPVELRYGSCTVPGALAYPMSAPDAGESETDLSINLKEFNTKKPMAILLYRSPQDQTIIACGDIQ